MITLFTIVHWHNQKCMVTNAHVCGGKKIQISPLGNGNSPAKYFIVFPDEVTILDQETKGLMKRDAGQAGL